MHDDVKRSLPQRKDVVIDSYSKLVVAQDLRTYTVPEWLNSNTY